MAHVPLTTLMEALVERMEQEQPTLDRLDADGGDADHGTTMVLAARAALASVHAEPQVSTLAARLMAAGDGFASVGGTVGPLWAAAWYAAADGVADGRPTSDCLRGIASRAVAAVKDLGGAEEGDATMLDALAAASGTPCFEGMLATEFAREMATAAKAGAAATAGRPARRGRASRSGVVRDSPDPGATSAAIVLDVIAGWLAGAPMWD